MSESTICKTLKQSKLANIHDEKIKSPGKKSTDPETKSGSPNFTKFQIQHIAHVQ